MTIVPDDKDWTWVLSRVCPDCGFDHAAHPPESVADSIRANAAAWGPLLADPRVRQRPVAEQWSALEYACHVRDVFELAVVRNRLMLTEDDPAFANWDQDATAEASGYGAQDPAAITRQIASAAEALAAQLDGVSGEAWDRTGRRGDGASFTVATFAVYLLHDPVHHLWDVHRGYALLS